MRLLGAFLFVVIFGLSFGGLSAGTARADAAFDAWLVELRAEARAAGVSAATLDAALSGLEPIVRVVELDRKQPEFTQTFWDYLEKRVSQRRIERGRELLVEHGPLLKNIEARYGVQPRFLVAFWGLETNFGDYLGKFSLVRALATLAYDKRRSKFFRAQLIALLQLIDAGDVALDAKGSWAGAMGQPQFIPTTYRDFAVDGDGDGKRDLIGSLPDVFASAANYLSRSGWNGSYTWGREVKLPQGFDYDLTGLKTRRSLLEWGRLGIKRADGRRALPQVDIEASLILPEGAEGPAFLVYKNYRTIMVWNRSILYALAVGRLSDRLAGQGGLLTPKPRDARGIAVRDLKEIQTLLNTLGYDAGKPDGIKGAKTRNAIKAFQRKGRLPADGHPDRGVLERLRMVAGQG